MKDFCVRLGRLQFHHMGENYGLHHFFVSFAGRKVNNIVTEYVICLHVDIRLLTLSLTNFKDYFNTSTGYYL